MAGGLINAALFLAGIIASGAILATQLAHVAVLLALMAAGVAVLTYSAYIRGNRFGIVLHFLSNILAVLAAVVLAWGYFA